MYLIFCLLKGGPYIFWSQGLRGLGAGGDKVHDNTLRVLLRNNVSGLGFRDPFFRFRV